MHTTTSAKWPGYEAVYSGGDCKNCHDVHGTAAAYDELRTETSASVPGIYKYVPGDYSFCFNCHDNDGPGQTASNIKRYYPTEASGTASPDRYQPLRPQDHDRRCAASRFRHALLGVP